MADLLSSLPGDIPGLLLRGSPVLVTIGSDEPPVRGLVLEPEWEPDEVDPRCLVWTERNGRDNKAQMFVDLDLTNKRGRADAAWWVRARLAQPVGDEEWLALCAAEAGREMTPIEIDALARLVLRLAGRE